MKAAGETLEPDAKQSTLPRETLAAMGRDPAQGTPAASVAQAYVASVQGTQTGAVIEAAGAA